MEGKSTASTQQSNIEKSKSSKRRYSARPLVSADTDKEYITDRRAYLKQYYLKNKQRIKLRKAEKYRTSMSLRAYHRKKSKEWYHRNKVTTGKFNRTILQTPEGKRLYSIKYAANAFGISTSYFRDLTKQGWIPEASYRAIGKWRMYTKDQLRLLKRASEYYYKFANQDRMQAVLFCFWCAPATAMKLSLDDCLVRAMAVMKKTAKRADRRDEETERFF